MSGKSRFRPDGESGCLRGGCGNHKSYTQPEERADSKSGQLEIPYPQPGTRTELVQRGGSSK